MKASDVLLLCALFIAKILAMPAVVAEDHGDAAINVQLTRAVDIVQSCFYIEEGDGRMGMFASGFTRDPATLVLHGVHVPDSEALDSFTDYVPASDAGDEAMIFEAFVSSVPVPEAESLLHADCNGQEITCEISRYYPQEMEGKDETEPVPEEPPTGSNNELAWFITSLQVSGGGVSVTLVMKTQPVTKSENANLSKKQKKLGLLLGPMGTLLLSVEFAVYTRTPSIYLSIGQTVQLDCGFTEGNSTAEKIGVEWRLQHKGMGRRIYRYKEGVGIADHPGAQMELQNMTQRRNVSLVISDFEIKDEGTYICIVYATRYHAQQVMQALIMEPPKVQLIPPVLYLQPQTPMRVSCEIGHYYPLDVEVTWLMKLPGDDEEPKPLSGVSFSSHRQNRDGTYNVSSYIWIQPLAPSEEPDPIYMCQVTHITLQEPITVTLATQRTEEPISGMILGLIAGTCLFMLGIGILMCRLSVSKKKIQ